MKYTVNQLLVLSIKIFFFFTETCTCLCVGQCIYLPRTFYRVSNPFTVLNATKSANYKLRSTGFTFKFGQRRRVQYIIIKMSSSVTSQLIPIAHKNNSTLIRRLQYYFVSRTKTEPINCAQL